MTLEEYIADARLQRDQRIAAERQKRRDDEAARLATIPLPLQPFVVASGDALNADLIIRAPGLQRMSVASNGIIRVGDKVFNKDFVEATAFASDPPQPATITSERTI